MEKTKTIVWFRANPSQDWKEFTERRYTDARAMAAQLRHMGYFAAARRTAPPKGYNGHKNWTHWNVSLWISNDGGLYRIALQYVRECPSLDSAVDCTMAELTAGFGGLNEPPRTPDGARYTKTSVRAALRGLE